MYILDVPMEETYDYLFRLQDDTGRICNMPTDLAKELKPYEEQMFEKFSSYCSYDENGIPLEAFNQKQRLEDKEWWLKKYAQVRSVFVKHLGEGQDYSKFDDYIENFESYVG